MTLHVSETTKQHNNCAGTGPRNSGVGKFLPFTGRDRRFLVLVRCASGSARRQETCLQRSTQGADTMVCVPAGYSTVHVSCGLLSEGTASVV
jgi:hypothetical protein